MKTKSPFPVNQGHPARTTTSAARSEADGTATMCVSSKWLLPSMDDPFSREFAPSPKAPPFDLHALEHPRTLTSAHARRVATARNKPPNITAKKCWPK